MLHMLSPKAFRTSMKGQRNFSKVFQKFMKIFSKHWKFSEIWRALKVLLTSEALQTSQRPYTTAVIYSTNNIHRIRREKRRKMPSSQGGETNSRSRSRSWFLLEVLPLAFIWEASTWEAFTFEAFTLGAFYWKKLLRSGLFLGRKAILLAAIINRLRVASAFVSDE